MARFLLATAVSRMRLTWACIIPGLFGALALQARERGYTSASELERLANEAMAHAEELERRICIVTPPAEKPQQVAQQQQQPQKKE